MAEVTRNAANDAQVKSHDDLNARERDQELNDLRALLQTGEGRRFVWRMMSHCKVFGTIWSQSALIHYNSGKQDVGHYLLGEVTAADEDSLFLMMKEARNAKEAKQSLINSINSQGATDV